MTIQQIPKETLDHFFFYLTLKDCSKASFVCKEWNELCHRYLILFALDFFRVKPKMEFNTFKVLSNKSFIKLIKKNFPDIANINICANKEKLPLILKTTNKEFLPLKRTFKIEPEDFFSHFYFPKDAVADLKENDEIVLPLNRKEIVILVAKQKGSTVRKCSICNVFFEQALADFSLYPKEKVDRILIKHSYFLREHLLGIDS